MDILRKYVAAASVSGPSALRKETSMRGGEDRTGGGPDRALGSRRIEGEKYVGQRPKANGLRGR